MKKQSLALRSTLILNLLACTGLAQPAEPPARSPEGSLRGLPHPIMMALDIDQNGELSPAEIENATVALKKLDRNHDGKLDRLELRPPVRVLGGNPRLEERGPGQPGSGPDIGALFAQRIMRFDQDGDGKVTKDELPERMDRILQQADINHDEAIDQAEAELFARQFRGLNRPGRPSQPVQSPPPPKEPPDNKP